MTARCRRCGHLASDHGLRAVGRGRCQALFGSFSDWPTFNDQCVCTHYRPPGGAEEAGD